MCCCICRCNCRCFTIDIRHCLLPLISSLLIVESWYAYALIHLLVQSSLINRCWRMFNKITLTSGLGTTYIYVFRSCISYIIIVLSSYEYDCYYELWFSVHLSHDILICLIVCMTISSFPILVHQHTTVLWIYSHFSPLLVLHLTFL
jgi:hypothetical protein